MSSFAIYENEIIDKKRHIFKCCDKPLENGTLVKKQPSVSLQPKDCCALKIKRQPSP